MSAHPATPESDQPRVPLRLWLLAGVGAVALHVACVAIALAHLRADDEADELGARAIAIGIELASTRSEPTDLPAGPENEASAASPAVQEQQAVPKQTELPKDVVNESETPDRVVTEKESSRPKEEQPQISAVQTAPSEESVAAEAAAAPSIEKAPEATATVAPTQGIGASARRVKLSWQKELVAHFDHHKRYPANRAARAVEIVVGFELDRRGHIVASRVERSSGDAAFDEAALAMLRRSDPVPAPPALVADEGLRFTLPVLFRVKGKS
jgi:periplasmic protein TonB